MQYVNNYSQQYPYNYNASAQGYQSYGGMTNNYLQQPNVVNKIVDSLEVVRATDIPMDGNIYYFPKADGTEIYGKRWLPNCTTEIISYKRVVEENIQEPNIEGNKIDLLTVMSRFDELNEKFDKLEKSLYSKQSNQNKRKENVNE